MEDFEAAGSEKIKVGDYVRIKSTAPQTLFTHFNTEDEYEVVGVSGKTVDLKIPGRRGSFPISIDHVIKTD